MSHARLMLIVASLFLLGTPSLASAQATEVGLAFGRGPLNYDENLLPTSRTVFGAEVCAYCVRSSALFIDYSHWGRPGVDQSTCQRYYHRTNCTTGYLGADTVAVGARFQGSATRRARMFGDLGVVVGGAQLASGSWGGIGGVGGIGTTIGFHRYYMRLAARVMFMSGHYIAANATVGAGLRF